MTAMISRCSILNTYRQAEEKTYQSTERVRQQTANHACLILTMSSNLHVSGLLALDSTALSALAEDSLANMFPFYCKDSLFAISTLESTKLNSQQGASSEKRPFK